jgi:hypothetical protein
MSYVRGSLLAMTDYVAAWVPERQDMDWDDAVAIAVDWTERECARQGIRQALLITHTKDHPGEGPLGAFASRHYWTTPQSRNRVDVPRGRPVLAYVPDARVLDLAAGYARGSSLCAVEGFGYPLAGWARAAGALDLLTTSQAAPVDDAMRKALDGLHFYGNNGWTRGFGQEQAQRKLELMREAGQLDKETILGDMLARGHGAKAVARLGDLVDRVAGSPRRR